MKTLIFPAVITVAIIAGAWSVGRSQDQPAARPDFSGKWAVDGQASSPGLVLDGMGLVQPSLVTSPTTLQPSFANAFTARQDSEFLRVQRQMGGGRLGVPTILSVVYYRLDGTETTNVEGAITKTDSGHASPLMVSTATWQNSMLRILTRIADADASLPRNNLERVMSLDASSRLVIGTKNGIDPTYLTVYRRVNQ